MGLLAAVLAACSETPAVESAPETTPALGVTRQALIPIPADSSFYPYRCQGASAGDISGDPVTGNRERDMVGDATFPAFYRAADANYVFFRMRIDGYPLKANGIDLQPSSYDVLLDTDGNLQTYEFMLTADGNMAGTKVRWVRNSIQQPGNPRDPAADNLPADLLNDFTPATDYYNVRVAGDGSAFSGDPDYFVTLVIPKTSLVAAGLNLANSFVAWGGTNAQNYSLNADFGCYVGMPSNLADAAPEAGPLDPTGIPDAIADTVTTPEDTAVTTAVLANDTGLRDTPITVTIITPPASGTVVVNAGNTVTYTPAPNFNGTVTYTYRVQDVEGHGDTAVVTVTVTSVNDPPTTNNDSFTMAEDSGATVVDVLANDSSSPDVGETLTVTAVSQPAAGATVSLNAGVVRFTPAPNFNGTATFTYTVSDGNGGTATDTVMVTVSPVNDPPSAANDTLTVAEDSGATVVDVLANDSSSPDVGETLTVAAVTQPANGTVSLVGGVVRFMPAPNFNGTTMFSYTVSDGNGGTATAMLTATVTPVNDPPTGVADTFSVIRDSGPTILDVLANDSIAPDTGETLTVSAVTQPPSGGTVSIMPGRTAVVFTPAPGFSGPVTFTYIVSDSNGDTATVTVTTNVLAGNLPPTASDDTFIVAEDSGATMVDVLANDSFAPDTDEMLTVTAVTQPSSGGTVMLSGGGVSFTPAPNFHGTVTFTYTISDGNGGFDTAAVTAAVTPMNDLPTAANDLLEVAEDSGATVVDVLANDSSAPDTDETLTVTAVTQPSRGGTVTLSGGVVSFTLAPNFHGTVTFTYTISDGNDGFDTATITVDVTPVNDPPTAVDDMITVTENSGPTVINVLANDSSAPDGPETLTVAVVTQPALGGTVTLAAGDVIFTPAPDFHGTVTFTYAISDGNGESAIATVLVTVTKALTAVNDTLIMAEDSGPSAVNVLANDTLGDVGGTLTVTRITEPAQGGTVTLAPSVVTFTPAHNFHGTATFSYTASDGNGSTDTATVTITVTPVNDPPTGEPDTLSLAAVSGPILLDVLRNDSCTPDDGETLTVSAVTQPYSGGTVSIAPGGTGVVFIPVAGSSSPVSFTYTISDGNGGFTPVTVDVITDNTLPAEVVQTVAEDSGPMVVDIKLPDTGDAGEPLTVTSVTQPAQGGTVTLAYGVVIFTPAPDFYGTVTFSYTLSGGNGTTATDTATITVTPVNDPPTGGPDTFLAAVHQGPIPLDVLANDSSAPDGAETLTVTEVTQPTEDGTVTLEPGSLKVVFTPDPDFSGRVTFTYTVSDGNGGADTVSVNVNAADSDEDGLTDDQELELGTHLENSDTDGDGLSDGLELGLADADPSTATDPLNPDSDGDGLTDGTEDANHDGLVDGSETDPNSPDTDHGGVNDGEEVTAGGDPLDPGDDLTVAAPGCAATGAGTLLPLVLLLALLLPRRHSRAF